jgi:hypothetical protein
LKHRCLLPGRCRSTTLYAGMDVEEARRRLLELLYTSYDYAEALDTTACSPRSAPSATPTTTRPPKLRRQLQDRADPRPGLAHLLSARARARRVRRLVQHRAPAHLARRRPAGRVRTRSSETIGSRTSPLDGSRKPMERVSAEPGRAQTRQTGSVSATGRKMEFESPWRVEGLQCMQPRA